MFFSLRKECYFSLFLFLIVACTSSATLLFAQEINGSITGFVMDQQQGSISGATVKVTNVDTNISTVAITNENGNYTIVSLAPAMYAITVEASGFKKVTNHIEVHVSDKLALDFSMETGELKDLVNIKAEDIRLETSSASIGQVVDQRRIAELPLSDGNPYLLGRLVPGATFSGTLANFINTKPFDVRSLQNTYIHGVRGHQLTIDGIPNTQNQDQLPAFTPPTDAVREFKVATAAYDAQQGSTAGSSVDLVIKNGTNNLKGSLYYFNRNDALAANNFFLNRSGTKRQPVRYHRYGGSVGGPVMLPRIGEGGPYLINGRDRTFFFSALEGLRDNFPRTATFTVPTLAMRNGDFTGLPAIYDPFNYVTEGSRVRRQQIQCNGRLNVICPERISPIARNFLQYYPLPNLPGNTANFISPNSTVQDFKSFTGRIDHNIDDHQRVYVRYSYNRRDETAGPWSGEVNGIIGSQGGQLRINHSVAVDYLNTLNPTTVLNVRTGFMSYVSSNIAPSEGKFDVATLGFSQLGMSRFIQTDYLPFFNIGSISSLGAANTSNASTDARRFMMYTMQPTLTKIMNNHTLRAGYDIRIYLQNQSLTDHSAGRYDFTDAFTRGPLDNASGQSHHPFASFLLGLPVSGTLEHASGRSIKAPYHGFFIHDDWKVNQKLTLNLGLRYELEPSYVERYNRIVRGFDTTSSNPIEAAARAAYATSYAGIADKRGLPTPENFNVRGGLLFPTSSNRAAVNPDKNNFQPRLGFAYKINNKTVARGGFGIFVRPTTFYGIQSLGFSASESLVSTLNSGQTVVPGFDLATPFSKSPVILGSSLGLGTFIGRDITFGDPNRKNTESRRFSLSIQRELPGNTIAEASYVGNYSYNVETNRTINGIPDQYLSRSLVRDQTTIDFLNANIPNPFRGLELARGTNLFTATNIQRQQLLRPFPQFGRITNTGMEGRAWYHGGQFSIQKRFSQGYTVNAHYTFSKNIEQRTQLTEGSTTFERRISVDDVPHAFAMSGIAELPFGHGRRFGKGWNKLTDTILGGWQVGGIYLVQSGLPLELGNISYFGNNIGSLKAVHGSDRVNSRIFDISGFYPDRVVTATSFSDSRINLQYNYPSLPSTMSNLRRAPISDMNLSLNKKVYLSEAKYLELRAEFMNALNHPIFDTPNLSPRNAAFGVLTTQGNQPRSVQLGLKLIF